ncbi:MAG: GNAT family N-acetyltransferase [Thermoclostridium sp.]|nr:GNAT family N-acetyltransferase [Thermoclostridium sp.]
MIKGEKILLRTFQRKDLESVYRLICDINNKGPYWHLSIPSEAEFVDEFNKTGLWGKDEGRMLIMNHDEQYLGELLFFRGLEYQSGYEIGYELFHPSHGGKGYMSEALQLFCAYMFAIHPINRLQVNVMRDNTGSRRVAEHCGFVYEGTMRKATFHNGKYHDLELFSILREECPSLSSLLPNNSDR